MCDNTPGMKVQGNTLRLRDAYNELNAEWMGLNTVRIELNASQRNFLRKDI